VYDRLVARQMLDNASVLAYSSPGEQQETRDLGLTAPAVVIPHGIEIEHDENTPRGCFRAKHLDGRPGPIVLFLSRLNAKKGLDLLTLAFALVAEERPDALLAIVGSADPPPFSRRVANWVSEAGIGNCVVMPGLLAGDEKRHAFADAHVFVLPSEAENFGFAMFEAMSSGVPVVVSDTLDYAGEVARSGAGFAVPREPAAFADAIVALLRDNDLRSRMGESGIQMASAYSWDANGERLERTMRCVLDKTPLPMDSTGDNGAEAGMPVNASTVDKRENQRQ
jgi:glycosyltransferase involved in cell wall biosynthesis